MKTLLITVLFFIEGFQICLSKPETKAQSRLPCQAIKGVVPDENCNYVMDDMVMTEEQLLQAFGIVAMNGQTDLSRMWPNGEIPILFDTSVGIDEQNHLWEVAAQFNSEMNGCLRMAPWNGQQDHLKIIKSGGCWSYVGMNGGEQFISLNGDLDPSTPGCWWKHTIVHEFIHAFGFTHEQQRPDRDDYVKVIWQNIPESLWSQFQIWEGSHTYGVPYDGKSVMHYTSKSFSNYSSGDGNTIESKRPDLWTTDQLKGYWMSENDKKKLKAMYQCGESSCGGELTEKSGIVTSPEWPSPYPSHQNCSWKITCDANVEIKIKNLEIGPDIADCCPVIKLKMSENPALASLALVGGAGTFENAPPVNGRPAWISYYKDYAIWYVPDYNSWVVGSSSQIGTGIMNLKGGDGTCPRNVTEWKVWNGLGYEETSEDDIKFECTEKACCPRMELSMFNDAALAPLVPAGIFKETDIAVNGRPAWISKNSFYAVWYVPDDNSWVVGSSSSMGNSGFVYIKGEDAPCPQEVTSWRFYNGAELEIANAGDVMMECKPEPKLILLGPGGTSVQVVDVASTSYCNNLPPYPEYVKDTGAGGVINGMPIICGGRTNSNGEVSACYAHNRTLNTWELFVDLAVPRKIASSAVLKSGALMVTGGLNQVSPYYLRSVELIFPNGTLTSGPDLPKPLVRHCMTTMHDGRVMTVGTEGFTSGHTVYIFDPSTDTWTNGPNLLFSRGTPACTTFNSPLHGGRPVVIAAGGSLGGGATAEIYDYTIPGKSWEQIADLPTIHFSSFGGKPGALPSFSGDGVYVHYYRNFYELTCDTNSCSWSVMTGKAATTVNYNTMMYLPPDYTCSGNQKLSKINDPQDATQCIHHDFNGNTHYEGLTISDKSATETFCGTTIPDTLVKSGPVEINFSVGLNNDYTGFELDYVCKEVCEDKAKPKKCKKWLKKGKCNKKKVWKKCKKTCDRC